MDILNFISWIKAGNYRATLPTDTTNLLAIGAKDPSRDDQYLSLAVNAAPLQTLYDTANVTQLTSISTGVTVNAHTGVITTVSTTLASLAEAAIVVTNSKVTTASKIFCQVQYAAASDGNPTVHIAAIANGSFTINILNASLDALNAVVKIHFMIVD